MKSKKVIAFIMAMSLLSVPAAGNVFYAVEPAESAVAEADSSVADYTAAQKAAYTLISQSCSKILSSNVTLSTNAFDIITLSTPLTMSEIGPVISDFKLNNPILDKVGLYSSANNSKYDQIALFTKEEYRTAAGRVNAVPKAYVSVQPESKTAALGETVSYSVKAEGTGLRYQWQVKTASSTTWKNCSSTGNTTDTMTFKVSSAWDGAKVRCAIIDSTGATIYSDEASMTVKAAAIVISSQPANNTAAIGETVSYSVGATGTGLTYQWQVKTAGTTTWKNCSSTGNKTDTMTFKVSSAWNGAKVRCLIKDSSGTSVYTNEASMTVSAATIAITTQPTDKSAALGDTVSFNINATGTGLTYQWQVKTAGSTTWKNCSSTGNNTNKMTFKVSSAWNGAKIRCLVKDSSGASLYSDEVTMTVGTSTLAITKQPTSITAVIGTTVSYDVAATGTGLTYQWQVKTAGSTAWKNCTSTGNNTNKMTFKVSSAWNGAKVRCLIKDGSGKSVYSNEATMTIGTAALAVTKQPENKTAALGDTVSFNVAATGTNLTYQWQVKTLGSTTWKNCSSTGNKTDTMTFKVSSAWNGAKVRCLIKDATDGSVYTNEVTMTVK